MSNDAKALVRAHDEYERPIHPAILLPNEYRAIIARITAVFLGILLLSSLLGGCAYTEHRDGGGYTVRWADDLPPTPLPRRVNYAPTRPAKIVVVERIAPDNSRDSDILFAGTDKEIPREYAKYVSTRGVPSMTARHRMCVRSRPGYCSAPNVPHCHGSYCHAHTGGDTRHTH